MLETWWQRCSVPVHQLGVKGLASRLAEKVHLGGDLQQGDQLLDPVLFVSNQRKPAQGKLVERKVSATKVAAIVQRRQAAAGPKIAAAAAAAGEKVAE